MKNEDVPTLKKEIARLKTENKRLREQISLLQSSSHPQEKSHSDSIREQQHNYFKYSNARRY